MLLNDNFNRFKYRVIHHRFLTTSIYLYFSQKKKLWVLVDFIHTAFKVTIIFFQCFYFKGISRKNGNHFNQSASVNQ